MASISFVSADGTENTYHLDKSRPLQIGRDPGNDVVLRDPRVSRQHAEVVFDRGFFVIRDLGSSNGTHVNGKKVQVAPLTSNIELRLGNSVGRFIDSPTELDPSNTLSVDLFKATAADEESEEVERRERESLQKKVRLPDLGTPPDDEGPFPEGGPPSTTGDRGRAGWESVRDREATFLHSRYLIDVSPGFDDPSVVRDERGNGLLYYRRPANVVGLIAGFVSALVLVGGLASAAFLAAGTDYLAALLAVIVTLAFSAIILLLVPRRNQLQLHRDQAGAQVALMLWQESQFSFPVLRFSLRAADGHAISLFSRGPGSAAGRRRWRIEDPDSGTLLGCAVESPLVAAVLRKLLGSFFGLVRTDFRLVMEGEEVGWIARRSRGLERHTLDLTSDPLFILDRRTAIGLAVLIDGIERK